MTTLSALRRTFHTAGGLARRHVPLALYAGASLSMMGWVAWTLIRLP